MTWIQDDLLHHAIELNLHFRSRHASEIFVYRLGFNMLLKLNPLALAFQMLWLRCQSPHMNLVGMYYLKCFGIRKVSQCGFLPSASTWDILGLVLSICMKSVCFLYTQPKSNRSQYFLIHLYFRCQGRYVFRNQIASFSMTQISPVLPPSLWCCWANPFPS